MTKQLHNAYPSPADVEGTFAALSGEGWPLEKARVLSDGSLLVSRHEAADGGVVIVSSRSLPAGIPGFLKAFLPGDNRAVQTDSWGPADADGVRPGSWKADIPGAPAQVGGTMRIEPTATGSTYVIDGAVTVKVPLIGGKAETFIAEMTTKLTDREAQVLVAMLS